MSQPTGTLWEIEPHTQVKHKILWGYLGAWFGIVGGSNPRVVYLDGFSGPGKYRGGEDGSPILAMKIALGHDKKNHINEVTFIFVEENEARFKNLQNEISVFNCPSTFHVITTQNQFENTLSEILDGLDKKGELLAPTFAFIDPFGFKGAPYKLVERLLNNPKTEVFINIMADSINRFINHPNIQIRQQIVDLFGTTQVLNILNIGGNGIPQLCALYQSQLRKCAQFVRYFEMRDENDRVIYFLFFATNNRLGHKKMKEVFWKVDNSSGCHFSDATNPDQLVLFEEEPSNNLVEILPMKYAGQRVTVNSIKQFIEDETPYIVKHMNQALRDLETADKLCPEPIKLKGEKRRKGTFPDDVIICFP
jgi:three-Cys-motif partner protein